MSSPSFDVGSGIMLVSDDPYGGRGILHVIDVRDPTAPRLLTIHTVHWTLALVARMRRAILADILIEVSSGGR